MTVCVLPKSLRKDNLEMRTPKHESRWDIRNTSWVKDDMTLNRRIEHNIVVFLWFGHLSRHAKFCKNCNECGDLVLHLDADVWCQWQIKTLGDPEVKLEHNWEKCFDATRKKSFTGRDQLSDGQKRPVTTTMKCRGGNFLSEMTEGGLCFDSRLWLSLVFYCISSKRQHLHQKK